MTRRFIRRSEKSDKTQAEMGRDLTESSIQDSNTNAAVIADIAQGVMEAQANLAAEKATANNQEILTLLQQINEQLKQQGSSGQLNAQANASNTQGQADEKGQSKNQSLQQNKTNQQQQGQQAGSSQNQSNDDPAEELVSQQLQNLFSQLLQGNRTDGQGQMGQNNSGGGNQQGSGQKQQSDKKNSVAVQTAAQVLAQAQYELANELEASLKKLKQVISESEKIANKISNLLGEENSSNNK